MNLTEIVILADTLVIVIMAGIGIFTSKQLDNRVRRIRELQVLLDEYSDINLELAKRINDKNNDLEELDKKNLELYNQIKARDFKELELINENNKMKKQIEGQKEVINLVATNKIKIAKKGEQW